MRSVTNFKVLFPTKVERISTKVERIRFCFINFFVQGLDHTQTHFLIMTKSHLNKIIFL